jgi:hypothetical protein
MREAVNLSKQENKNRRKLGEWIEKMEAMVHSCS